METKQIVRLVVQNATAAVCRFAAAERRAAPAQIVGRHFGSPAGFGVAGSVGSIMLRAAGDALSSASSVAPPASGKKRSMTRFGVGARLGALGQERQDQPIERLVAERRRRLADVRRQQLERRSFERLSPERAR